MVVCRLRSNNARSFASSFYHTVLEKPWITPPNDLELRFAEELKTDIRNGITDTFGLRELLLENNNFFKEFEKFCAGQYIIFLNYIISLKPKYTL